MRRFVSRTCWRCCRARTRTWEGMPSCTTGTRIWGSSESARDKITSANETLRGADLVGARARRARMLWRRQRIDSYCVRTARGAGLAWFANISESHHPFAPGKISVDLNFDDVLQLGTPRKSKSWGGADNVLSGGAGDCEDFGLAFAGSAGPKRGIITARNYFSSRGGRALVLHQ